MRSILSLTFFFLELQAYNDNRKHIISWLLKNLYRQLTPLLPAPKGNESNHPMLGLPLIPATLGLLFWVKDGEIEPHEATGLYSCHLGADGQPRLLWTSCPVHFLPCHSVCEVVAFAAVLFLMSPCAETLSLTWWPRAQPQLCHLQAEHKAGPRGSQKIVEWKRKGRKKNAL